MSCFFFVLQIQKKIDEFSAEGVKLEADRKEILDGLEEATKAAEKKRKENEVMLATTAKILDQLKKGKLYWSISCCTDEWRSW